MAIENITIQQFLELAEQHPVLDVRSPGEFAHAHIPGAYSLPLFTDEERKITGTAYKQQSKQHAIKIGLEFFGKKMVAMIEEVEKLTQAGAGKTVLVHCWRGGMRSTGVAWLLNLYGFKVYALAGGYKAFRTWVLKQFEKQYAFKILGGYTGSGKTEILKILQQKGEAVIDLEALANHKGSAFGNLGEPEQPSQEMFENRLAMKLSAITNQQPAVWLEDESQRIGTINIPNSLYRTITTMPVYFLHVPFEERLKHITDVYGRFDTKKLEDSITRIKKRLGGLETKTAINFLHENDITNCFRILLTYYDKYYKKSLFQKQNLVQFVKNIDCEKTDALQNAEILLKESAGVTIAL